MTKDEAIAIKEKIYTNQAEVVTDVANLANQLLEETKNRNSSNEFILDMRRRLNAALDLLGTAKEELEYAKHPDFGRPDVLIKRIEEEIPKLHNVEQKYTETFDLSRCPRCGGDADQGHDRCIPPNPYVCSKCQKKSEDAQD